MSNTELSLDLADPEATRALGRRLGSLLEPGLVVALLGDLGAGKTTLSKAAIAALGAFDEDDVVSPTFVIANEYPGPVEVLHVDAYRLAAAASFEDLGFGPLDQGERAVLIEWADRIAEALPGDRLEVELEHVDGARRATLRASGPRGQRVLAGLREALD
jgi:tRNA threonylcarbamoyladenosine biosynthesis protein TsaE